MKKAKHALFLHVHLPQIKMPKEKIVLLRMKEGSNHSSSHYLLVRDRSTSMYTRAHGYDVTCVSG